MLLLQRGLHRSAGKRPQGLPRRLRGHRRPRHRRAGPPLRGRSRRLQRHHGQGLCRPAGRGLCRAAARNRPARLGLWAGRKPLRARHAGGEVSRHPPCARLSVAARPHREADALRPLGRRACGLHHAHRELHDAARRFGERLVLRPSRFAVLRHRPRHAGPSGGLRPPQGLEDEGSREVAFARAGVRSGVMWRPSEKLHLIWPRAWQAPCNRQGLYWPILSVLTSCCFVRREYWFPEETSDDQYLIGELCEE